MDAQQGDVFTITSKFNEKETGWFKYSSEMNGYVFGILKKGSPFWFLKKTYTMEKIK